MKNKNLWSVLIFIAVFIAASVITYSITKMSFEKAESKTALTEYYEDVRKDATSDESFKGYYMDGCVAEGEEYYDYCKCTYDYLLNKVGKSGMVELAFDMYSEDGMSTKTTNLMTDAVIECLDEYPE